ncbi:MAG TPA: cation transporter [Candidatus Faecimonas gallistercoris]|nr:cation transporter [Candidatus Faecimonas gallistercoris]
MDRYKLAKRTSILGIVGLIMNGQSSARDIFFLLTLIRNKIASRPSDKDLNLNHSKIEYIYSLLISIAMIIMGLTAATDYLKSIISKQRLLFSTWLIVICIIIILTKLALYVYTRNIANERKL